jgi:zinc-ribbon domain
MAFCVNCGKPLTEGQKFCPGCGTALGQPGAGRAGAGSVPTPSPAVSPSAAPPSYAAPAPTYAAPAAPPAPPPTYAAYPPPGQPPYGPPGYPAQQPRGRKGLWISLVACVLIVAVACVLVFVVFGDDIFKGGGAASTPGQTVSKVLKAMESKDIDAMFSLMDQKTLGAAMGGMSVDDAKQALKSAKMDYQSVKFSGIKMKTETTSGTTATVTITEGTVTIIDSTGQETTEDVRDADEPVNFELTKVGGKWYLNPTLLSGSLGGGSYTTTTEMNAPTTTDTTDTTTGETTVTTTGETTATTAGAVTAQGSASPEDAVRAFLDAYEKKDMMGVLVLMDPLTVEDALGMSIEEAQFVLEGEMFDFQSLSFSGVKLAKESTGDTTATVTITEGSATITDSSGQTSTEDVVDAGEPVTFLAVQENGLWYLDPTAVFPGE